MRYQRIFPSGPASSVVLFFWEFEGEFSDTNPYEHSLTASVNPKLAFQYSGKMSITDNGRNIPIFDSGFQCQTNSFHQISACECVGTFGAYFHPFALPVLFGIAADQLNNQNIQIAELLGQEGNELEEAMMLANNTEMRVRVMSSFIEHKLQSGSPLPKSLVWTVDQIITSCGKVDLLGLVSESCLSQRQFERKFREFTGFSAKMFSRIVRFDNCITNAVTDKQSLTQLSAACGYFDQSHMIRDFREFSGKHPKAYLTEDLSLFYE